MLLISNGQRPAVRLNTLPRAALHSERPAPNANRAELKKNSALRDSGGLCFSFFLHLWQKD